MRIPYRLCNHYTGTLSHVFCIPLPATREASLRPTAHLPHPARLPRPGSMLTHANLIANTAGRLVNFTTRTPRPVHPHPGAVLTHGNLVANAAGTATLMVDFAPGDRHLSYLPLAHIYERSNIVLVGAHGRVYVLSCAVY